jgi:hypothetical protein
VAIEQPPIKDQGLASYLVRAFTALQSTIDSVKTHFVLGEVKNPQTGKLYFVKNATSQLPTEGLYFFNGASFVKLTDTSSAVKLGVSHVDAYYGDLGKIAYDHSNEIGNPHWLTAKDIGLEKVDNTADKDKPISDATQAAINGFVPASRRVNGQTLAADVTLGTGNVKETLNKYYVSYSQRLLVTYNANATTDGYLLSSDWVIFNSKQDALGFTPENIANKVTAWSSPTNVQYPSAKLVNDTFANYLPLSSFHEYYKGKYTSLSALTTAWPIASAGDYAQVDSGIADSVVNYNWDEETGWVIGSIGSGATNTDGLPEGSTNLYFTEPRVRSTLLTGFSSTAGTVGATDSIITAFNKVVGNIATKIGLTSLSATSPIVYNSSTGVFSIPVATTSADGYLSSTDWTTFNNKLAAFGSQTANFFYAAPNGSTGTPSFRAIVAADIPTLNQNTTGSAAKLTTARTINGVSFDGSANITIIAEATHAATNKATPVDADEFGIYDSVTGLLNKLTWSNLKIEVAKWNNPIGTIREFNVSTNPATLLGFGTWAAFGTGRATVAIDSGQTEFATNGQTGGEKTHLLTSSESGLPAHTHPNIIYGSGGSTVGLNAGSATSLAVSYSGTGNIPITVAAATAAAAAAAHNNLQPYIVVYRWVRTA